MASSVKILNRRLLKDDEDGLAQSVANCTAQIFI